jgi:hypothetical protein
MPYPMNFDTASCTDDELATRLVAAVAFVRDRPSPKDPKDPAVATTCMHRLLASPVRDSSLCSAGATDPVPL